VAGVLVLVINQLNTQILYFIISLLYVFGARDGHLQSVVIPDAV